MDIKKYICDLPSDLNVAGHEPELQLLKLYAFNSYYNADELHTEEVNDRCTYFRKNGFGIDGVFLNDTLEDNTIELIFSYYVGDSKFAIGTAANALICMQNILDDVSKGIFTSGNRQAENLLKDYLLDSESKTVALKVITDYEPTSDEKYQFKKVISNYDLKVKGLKISCDIVFGDDVEVEIESNKAPFDWVEQDKLIMDKPNNFLTYKDGSLVCNVSAKSIKELWAREGKRGLLAMNLRYYIKSKNIDQKIEDSMTFDYEDFWYLNNGIIIVCNDFNMVNNELRLSQFSIVNGGQTTRMIGEIPFENDFFICCKVIKNEFETSEDKNRFISKVAEATNTQKPIKPKDIIANKIEQRNLKSLMSENNIFIEIKRGEKFNHDVYKEPWQRTKNNELAQDLYSFVYMEPGPSRNSVSTMLSNNDKYNKIFVNHKYKFPFLKDLIILEKAYREYAKAISKDDMEDPTKKGLVKNGMFYCLATIGYILKLIYNKEYRENMYKYRNNDAMFQLSSTILAFNHGFIDEKISYKKFSLLARDLFDYIFSNLIKPEFDVARESNQSLAYSNWTKQNTGFNLIRKRIGAYLFDNKQTFILDYVKKFFVSIDEEQENLNIDYYVDNVKVVSKKITPKTSEGQEMNEDDVGLRNALMEYRLKYSLSHHIGENKVFTDKQLEKMVFLKPLTKAELSKCVSDSTSYYCGDDLLKIVGEHC